MLHSKKNREKFALTLTLAVCISILFVTVVSAFVPIHNEQRIYSNVIRLHVIANSDSNEDQALKYEVRDYIIEYISSLTEGCADIEDAREAVEGDLESINGKVSEYISEAGFPYTSAVTLTKEDYPTIVYGSESSEETFRLPKGKYLSLRILIGEAEGKNWWCVLFPPLCMSGTKVEDELAVAGYNHEQIKVLKNNDSTKYVVRFKILEILSELFE